MADTVSRTQQSLEDQVAQATRDIQETIEALEISNVELDLARKRALEASHLKSDFLAAMSHDIRTPMSGIIGFTQLLASTPLHPEQREQVLVIEQSAVALMQIINNILDLSRIEAGKLRLAQEPFDIRACVDDVLMLVSPLAYEKQLVINRCVATDVPWVLLGDQTRIQEIITNFMSNAIKFTDKGVITVQVRVSSRSADTGITLELSVQDTGHGIDEATQRQLFQAFGQSSPSTAKYPGTGLGLVICNRLVGAMGGDIRLESTPGEGSIFAATLKLEVAEDSGGAGVTAGTACLMEPELLTRMHLTQLLQRIGYEVHYDSPLERHVCIINGEDSCSLEAASGHGHLVILLDEYGLNRSAGMIQLPRVAGMGALQRALTRTGDGRHADQGTPLKGTSVLVVDDSRINRILMARQLEDLGASVIQADSGPSVLALDLTGVSIALLDLQMPGMSGVELAINLSQREQRPSLVAVTADATAKFGISSLQAGFSTLLVKPVSPEALLDTLRAVLERREAVAHQLAELPDEIRALLAEDLPPLASKLFHAHEARDHAAFAAIVHDIRGIAGTCKLGGLQAAAIESAYDTAQGMMDLYLELALIRTETWPEWKDDTC